MSVYDAVGMMMMASAYGLRQRILALITTPVDWIGRKLGSPEGFALSFKLYLVEALFSIPTMIGMYYLSQEKYKGSLVLYFLLPIMVTSIRAKMVAFVYLRCLDGDGFRTNEEDAAGTIIHWSYPATSVVQVAWQAIGACFILSGPISSRKSVRILANLGFLFLILANVVLCATSLVSFRWVRRFQQERQPRFRTMPALPTLLTNGSSCKASSRKLTRRSFAMDGSCTPEREFGSCSICLVEYIDGDILKELLCGHVFHEQCIDTWLCAGDARQCPLRCPLSASNSFSEPSGSGTPNEVNADTPTVAEAASEDHEGMLSTI